MAIQRTKSGKIDKRTKEGKQMLKNLEKARRVKARKEKSLARRIARLFK